MGRPRGLAKRSNAAVERRPVAVAWTAEDLMNFLLEMAGMEVSLFTGYCKRSRGLNGAEFRRGRGKSRPYKCRSMEDKFPLRRTASEGRPYKNGDIKSPLHFGRRAGRDALRKDSGQAGATVNGRRARRFGTRSGQAG